VILLARLGWENPSITDYIYYSLLYFLLFVIFSVLGGILGGYIKENRKLYPMTEFILEEQT
jgi:hypothetical protein